MPTRRPRTRALLAVFLSFVLSSTTLHAAEVTRPITLEVDARQAPQKIFHARLTLPVMPGPLTLVYPKWIPGEHGPTGPIVDVAGLKITVDGKPLTWRRDSVEMYAFHLDVPDDTESIDIALDYLSPPDSGGFTSAASATAQLALISWNQLVLAPQGARADDLRYAATLRLPNGWKFGTVLPVAKQRSDRIEFQPVSLTTLVDSPVLAGAHFRTVALTTAPIAHQIHLAADSDAALDMSPELTASFTRLVAESGALFGARHYRSYSFLLTLSDHTAHFGLEHHESSDDRVGERALIDDDQRRVMAGLLPHEMTHSWNGKYRRPADLAPGTFEEPMHGDLLWVYEGLTEYLGQVLTARSGLLTADEYRESLALTAAVMEQQRGRAWRPLSDTAIAAQILYGARGDWSAWRRNVDFYPEGELLWLEADTVIRRETNNTKTLDDFCRLFYGGQSGPPVVVPYTFDDILAALNQIAPYDWRTFWKTRLESTATHAPLGGVAASGWKLVYTDVIPQMQKSGEATRKNTDLRHSIGVTVNDDGTIPDVIPDSPAAKAGIGPGVKLVAVNGRRWSKDVLRTAVREAKPRHHPLELLVENGEFFKSYTLDYDRGEHYPHLERDYAVPDLLTQIITPQAGAPKAAQ